MAERLRFDRHARHAVALVGIVVAAYLNVATDFSTFIQAADYAGSIPNDVPLVNEVQFATILVVYLVSFALVSTTPLRRAVALTMVPLLLLGWAFLSVENGIGVLPLGDAAVWSVLLDQGFITIVVAVGGWLVATGLHPLSWAALLLALVPPFAARAVDAAQFDATTATLIIQGVVVGSGVIAVLIARLIDHAMRRGVPRSDRDRAVTPNGRYGLAVGGILFATYLGISTDFTNYLQQTNYAGTTNATGLSLAQFLLILGLYVATFSVMPVSGERRLAAVTFSCVLLLLWATFGIERSVGNVTAPHAFWAFVLDQGFVVMLASIGGWLIVRGRHPITWLVLAVAIVPPMVAEALRASSVTSGASTLVIEAVVVLGGFVAGFAAWGIDALARRSWAQPRVPRPAAEPRRQDGPGRPVAVTAVAVVVWIDGAVQLLTALLGFAGQGAAGTEQRGEALVSALITLLIGLATVLVGVGLLRGNRLARVVVTVFLVIGVLDAVFDIITALSEGIPAAAVISGVIAALNALGILLLWRRRARDFFRAPRHPARVVAG
ncbi:MAG TPA: hypothetical protein VN759_12875 [Pseudolysinimonas sp.]|nr:hypothetical protein [Pseudolysinimonas sp.]